MKQSEKSEAFYCLALSQVQKVGPVAGKSLIAYCGSSSQVFKEKKSTLGKIPNVSKTAIEAIVNFNDFDRIEEEFEFAETNQIQVLPYFDLNFPVRLKQLIDCPMVIFVKGAPDLNTNRVLGIVGTRKNSSFGKDFTEKLIADLVPFNISVISGLAFGIDIIAHKACIQNNIPTWAVVAHGLDLLYPTEHVPTAKKMVDNDGAIITEHLSKTAMHPDLFPRRNRIVAGLCDALLVVESGTSGGSIITAEIAHSYHKEVFAVPGKPSDLRSLGCNSLIKQMKANMCDSAMDIVQALNWNENGNQKTVAQMELFLEASEDEKKVLEIIRIEPKTFDSILILCEMPINKLIMLLFEMEMKQLIKQLPGKVYAIK